MLHLKMKTCIAASAAADRRTITCPFDLCSYQPGRKATGDTTSHTNTSWSQSLAILANHIRAKHTLEAAFECALCGKCLVTAMAHRYHVKQHENRAKFYCQACGRFFPLHVQEQHYAKSHDHVKSLACSRCGKCLSSKSSLELHQQVHDARFKFRCEFCHKQFHQKNNWLIHMARKHSIPLPDHRASKKL
jgi:transcription elongation factor Elf1